MVGLSWDLPFNDGELRRHAYGPPVSSGLCRLPGHGPEAPFCIIAMDYEDITGMQTEHFHCFFNWRSKSASEFRLERSVRSFNKYVASACFNDDPAPVASRADEFPAFVADLAYFIKGDEFSLSSGTVTSRTRYTARAFAVGALHVSIPREAKPENDLGAGAFLSRVGLAVPLSFL
jgi:hypothetical protein